MIASRSHTWHADCSANCWATKAPCPSGSLRPCSQKRVDLLTPLKKNLKNRLVPLSDKWLLRHRAILETINDHLKNISQIEHSRHRSPANFLVNVVCGLIAYCHQPKKPSLHLVWESLAPICL